MKDLLGINSANDLNGLSASMKETVYLTIKDQVAGFLVRMQQGLSKLETLNTVDQAFNRNAKIVAEDLANIGMASFLEFLTEMGTHKIVGINVISKATETYLEGLAQGIWI